MPGHTATETATIVELLDRVVEMPRRPVRVAEGHRERLVDPSGPGRKTEPLGERPPGRLHRRRGPSRRDAAVDDEVVPVDEAGFVRGEEDRCGGDVLGLDHPWHRLNGRKQCCERGLDVLYAPLRVLGARARRLREDRRLRGPRRDAVHAHALLPELDRRAAREMDERGLRNLVAERVEACAVRADARHVDERAHPARDHRR